MINFLMKFTICHASLVNHSGNVQAISSCFFKTLCQHVFKGTLHKFVVFGPEVQKIRANHSNQKIKTLLVVRGEEVGHCLLLPLVQAVWQGANRPKETDLHPVKKLVAGFHLPNHENILSKVRNQGEEVA